MHKAVVGAYLYLRSVVCSTFEFLRVRLENTNLDVLDSSCAANNINSEFLIEEVLALQVVEDSSCVAVLVLKTFNEHALKKLSRETFIVVVVDFDFGFALFLFLLVFFLLSNQSLQLFFLLFEVLGGFLSERVVALVPKINQLVETDYAALVLLGHKVCSHGLATAARAKQNHIQFLFFLEGRWQLDLQ